MIRNLTACILVALTCVGCAGLRIRDDDGVGGTTAKLSGRTVLWISSFGVSEFYYSHKRLAASVERQIGSASYDEILEEWGPPESVARGRHTIVAEWVRWHSYGPVVYLLDARRLVSLLKPSNQIGADDMTYRLTFNRYSQLLVEVEVFNE